jgi:hypothetical protein
MHRTRSRWRLLASYRPIAICLALIGVSGCRETLTTVSGKVTLDGKLLSNTPDARGTVVFHPQGGQGTVATALLDPAGEFNLAVGSSVEIPPGNYDVAISISKAHPQSSDGDEPEPEFLALRKYASVQDSGLQACVSPGENRIDFNLSSQDNDVPQ